ncbi:MAG: alpha/beta fold hydrolase [Fidelibacterota bacterium]
MSTVRSERSDEASSSIPRGRRLPWQLHMMRLGLSFLGSFTPGVAGNMALRIFLTPRRGPLAQREQQVLEDASVLEFSHRALQLRGYSWGEGPAVLFVHGWEGRASDLGAFVVPLVDKGYRVVSFDGPAHGNSPGKQTHLVDFGQAIRTVIERTKPVHGIIGHSFGAASTVVALAEDPKPAVRKVVLVASPSNLGDVVDRFTAQLGLPDGVFQVLHEGVRTRLGKPVEFFSVPAMAPSLEMPALVVHDEKDRQIPFSDAQDIVSEWPRASLMATGGLGHNRILRDPHVVEAIITFLSSE